LIPSYSAPCPRWCAGAADKPTSERTDDQPRVVFVINRVAVSRPEVKDQAQTGGGSRLSSPGSGGCGVSPTWSLLSLLSVLLLSLTSLSLRSLASWWSGVVSAGPRPSTVEDAFPGGGFRGARSGACSGSWSGSGSLVWWSPVGVVMVRRPVVLSRTNVHPGRFFNRW
jgi:hypothetical protein